MAILILKSMEQADRMEMQVGFLFYVFRMNSFFSGKPDFALMINHDWMRFTPITDSSLLHLKSVYSKC